MAKTKFKIGDVVYTYSSGESGFEVILFKINSIEVRFDGSSHNKITYYDENYYARYENELTNKDGILEMINKWLEDKEE